MGIAELRASGLLELYVIGGATAEEVKTVEQGLLDFPELKVDLYEIGGAVEVYAEIHKMEPSVQLKNVIMRKVGVKSAAKSSSLPTSTGIPKWLTYLLAVLVGILGILYWTTNNNYNVMSAEYAASQNESDSIRQANVIQYALMEQLQDQDNEVLAFSATEKFDQTDLFLLYNENSKRNFIQLKNIPPISAQESYQLWSLKAGQDPIPLTVFQGDEGLFIPVDFEDGTATYAITIEQRGGAQSRNLANLIGTINVPS
jgi:hypothetical protein